MTKKEILDILYSERNRLMSMYTRPGWTTWALVGAIASLLWIMLDLYFRTSISWIYSVAIYFLLYNIYVCGGCLVISFKNDHQPIWQKYEFTDRIKLVYAFIIYAVQLLLLIIHKSFFVGGISEVFYWFSIVFIAVLLLLFLLIFLLSFIPSLRTQKNNRWGGFLGLFFLLIAVTWGIFIIREHNFLDEGSIKVGLLLVAIGLLMECFNISTPSKLKKLDNLINKVLYENYIDEDAVMSELEKCMIGLKYGDYLMNQNYDYISKWTRYLYYNLLTLNDSINNSTGYNDTIHSVIHDSMKRIDNLQPVVHNVLKMIKLGYDETDVDPKLSPLLRVMQDSIDIIGIWLEIQKKTSEYNFEDFKKFVNLKEQEADIIFKKNNINNE